MRVGVFGLGYVGTVTAACLARRGHSVLGVDVQPAKVDAINLGASPIAEPGLEDLIRRVVQAGNLRATAKAAEAIEHADIILVCVGTPSATSGSMSTEYVDRVCSEVGRVLRSSPRYRLIVIRSTLQPGTFRSRLVPLVTKESGRQAGSGFGMATNPEFLREGSAIHDFENPPFTIIGQMDPCSGDLLQELYADIPAPLLRTDPDTASMVKYASNAFHALKVAFANEIGQLSKALGVDGTEVMEIFCQDTHLNISSRYLKPGFAFGGSCLPKDLRALLYLARHSDLQAPILESIIPSNRIVIQRTADRILADHRRSVGLIGLTFKQGTDDLRESPMVELAEILRGKGLQVVIYDENVALTRLIGDNKAYVERTIPHLSGLMCGSLDEAIKAADIIVVAHCPSSGCERLLELLTPDQLLIDLVKLLPNGGPYGFEYEGICW